MGIIETNYFALSLYYLDVCNLRIHHGRPCYGYSGSPGQKFGYVKEECKAYKCPPGKCKAFTYKGCGGNKNRFETMDECQINCEGKLPPPAPE